MVAARSLYELFGNHPGVRVVTPKQPDEEFGTPAAERSSAVEAPTLNDEPFAAHLVPQAGHTAFTHFLDGAQRSWPCLYVGLFQVRLAHTSSALVPRESGAMERMLGDSYRSGLEAFVPPEPKLEGLGELPGLDDVIPVGITSDDTDAVAGEKIQQAISRQRELREIDSSKSFSDGWLLVDGGIGRICSAADERQMVGLVKSHGRQYFKSLERAEIVMNLKVGERTTPFHRVSDPLQGEAAYSFYLRLREGTFESPLYGVVRVELPPRDVFTSKLDEIAGWILAERAPSSLPDPRHDKLLYPIRLVEQHLKARMPSEAAIRALIGL